MLYLVAYDVRAPKRLNAVAKICLRCGFRVGLSVFEIRFETLPEFEDFAARISAVIDPDADLVRIYRICENCRRERLILGKSIGENRAPAEGEAFIF